jgi:Family of unknown function (DUF5335)
MSSTLTVPREQWRMFLEEFSRRHCGWFVKLETHDVETEENVASRFLPLRSIELDTEDAENPRINVSVQSGNKEIKHILFKPFELTLYLTTEGADEAMRIESMNTSTTVRFRIASMPESADEVA